MLLFLKFFIPSAHTKVTLSNTAVKVAVDVNIVSDTFVRLIAKPENERLAPSDDEVVKGLDSLLSFCHLRTAPKPLTEHVSVTVSPGQISSGSCTKVTTCLKKMYNNKQMY